MRLTRFLYRKAYVKWPKTAQDEEVIISFASGGGDSQSIIKNIYHSNGSY